MNSSVQLIAKSDKTIELPLTDLPQGVTVTNAVLAVKSEISDPDASALIEILVSTADAPAGSITNDLTLRTASIAFNFTPADIDSLTVGADYYYAIKVWLSDSSQMCPGNLRGRLLVAAAGVEAVTP